MNHAIAVLIYITFSLSVLMFLKNSFEIRKIEDEQANLEFDGNPDDLEYFDEYGN